MSGKVSPHHGSLRQCRVGVAIHYSAGTADSTIGWILNPRSKVSYNAVIDSAGNVTVLVPWHLRAWHMGKCRPSDPQAMPYTDANSAFEGIALSGGPTYGPPTQQQIDALVALIRERFTANGWAFTETQRITSHDREAYPRGRKEDITGPNKATPWLDLNAIRKEVANVANDG